MFNLRYFRCVLSSNRRESLMRKTCLSNISRSIFDPFTKQKNFDLLQQTELRSCRGFRSKPSGGGTGVSKATHRRSLAPVEEVQGTPRGFGCLLRPFVFGIVVSASSFAGAAIWQYENMRNVAAAQIHYYGTGVGPSSSHDFYQKAGDARRRLNGWWNSLTQGQKVGATIIGLNALVFVLWRIPQLNSVMVKYFTSTPMSGAVGSSMLLSAFSHYSFFHLFCNMYVFWSFIPAINKIYGKEQFVATYITAAMASGFTSYAYKVARRSMVPSLGASGAIMAIIGAVCITFPHAQLSIAFVNNIVPHSFSADSAMKFLIIMDSVGLLMGWRLFDHAAHLGGMLFGIWYVKYGHKYIWHSREPFMRRWHALRGKP